MIRLGRRKCFDLRLSFRRAKSHLSLDHPFLGERVRHVIIAIVESPLTSSPSTAPNKARRNVANHQNSHVLSAKTPFFVAKIVAAIGAREGVTSLQVGNLRPQKTRSGKVLEVDVGQQGAPSSDSSKSSKTSPNKTRCIESY